MLNIFSYIHAVKHHLALLVNLLALSIENIVILENVLSGVEVSALNP